MNLVPTRALVAGLVVLVVVMLLPDFADACPNCKKGLGANHMALAYAYSILLMIGMPFSLMAGWLLIIFRTKESREETMPSYNS